MGFRAQPCDCLPRTLFLGSRPIRRPSPAGSPALGPMRGQGEVSHLAVPRITSGDDNPDCLGLLRPLVSGGPVAGRRFPPCPLSSCFARPLTFAGNRTQCQGAFSFFAVHFRARRQELLYAVACAEPRKFPSFPRFSTTIAQLIVVANLARCITRWRICERKDLFIFCLPPARRHPENPATTDDFILSSGRGSRHRSATPARSPGPTLVPVHLRKTRPGPPHSFAALQTSTADSA